MNTSQKELRVHHDQLYTLPSLFLEDYDTICLGHSGCIHKMAGLAEEHIQYILQQGKSAKIELPILFETHFERVMEKVQQFFHLPLNIVVNDWGTLHYLVSQQNPPHVSFSLGRQLVYSLMNCPWYEDILQNETNDIRKAYLQVNVDSDSILALLQQYGVKEIDLDMGPGMQESIQSLRKEGIAINAFLDYAMASMSRSCHTVRAYNESVGNCGYLCNEAIYIEPRQRWNRFEDTMIRIAKENRQKLGELIVYGNIVVQNKEWTGEEPFEVDSICDDFRFSPKQIRQEAVK